MSNLKIISFSSAKRLEIARNLCHKYRTYLYNGAIQYWIEHLSNVSHIILAFKNNIPVGSLVILKTLDSYCNCNCGTWVHENHRRQKIGTQMLQKVKKLGVELKPWRGDFRARSFYDNSLTNF